MPEYLRQKTTGERCFYSWQISTIIHYLSTQKLRDLPIQSLSNKVNKELKGERVSPLEVIANPKNKQKYNPRGKRKGKERACLYPETAIFTYFQYLEDKGQIELPYSNMQEIIEDRIHLRSV